MPDVINAIREALQMAFFMFWEVLWPLALGFLISAVVQSLVSREAVVRALGADDLRGVTLATVLGAASSSCSYAAVAVARGLFRKGSTFTNAIVFEFASTNLVFELGLVLLVLLGWEFLTAELAGGLLMIAILAVTFKYTLRHRMVDEAWAQAEKGLRGRMEGHGEMDMSVTDGPFLIAGALAAWVPNSFWQTLFVSSDPAVAAVWGPIIGPVIAMLTFVCSVGNIPLAVVLWNGGISFGGVISFIFADLLIIPILNIYRKYYGRRTSLYLLVTSYGAMVLAGLVIGALFQVLGLVPTHHVIEAFQKRPSWDYTTFLDFAALALALILGWRFVRTGGLAMLKAMETAPTGGHRMSHHDHHAEHHHH